MYYMPQKPEEITVPDQQVLRVATLVSDNGPIAGGFLAWFFGFQFTLLMAGLKAGVPTDFDRALYRPAGIRVVGSGVKIKFNWRDGARSGEIELGLANEAR
jgi:hypothetical protein